MQRLFSHFPSGLPGFGLITLRLLLAVFLVADGTRALSLDAAASTAGYPFAFVAAVLTAVAMLVAIGFMMPVTSTIVALIEAAILGMRWWLPDTLATIAGHDIWEARVSHLAVAVSLALIGPGAYSLDARLFGRREINIPPRRNAHGG